MKAKVCFNNEIHRISKLPNSLQELNEMIVSIFHLQLPQSWTLQYVDSDEDNILLSDEKDYGEFLNDNKSSQIKKIFIISRDILKTEQMEAKEEVREEPVQEEEYQVIENEGEKDSIKVESKESQMENQELESDSSSEQSNTEQQQQVQEMLHNQEEKPLEEMQEPQSPVQEVVNNSLLEAEEQKESQINQEPAEMSVSTEMMKSSILMEAKDLETLVESMIQKNLSKIVQHTKEQLSNQDKPEDKKVLESEKLEEPPVSKVVHQGIQCKGCYIPSIVGIRYKCTVCPNFDYCETCEESGQHVHHFIKMRNPELVIPKMPAIKKPSRPNVCFNKEFKPVDPAERKFKQQIETAYKLQKHFPRTNINILLEYVESAPEDLDFDELVENYKH